MTKIVDFNEAETAEPGDFTNIGVYARAADQGIIGGAIAYPHHWSRFTISQPTTVTLNLSPGLLFVGDKAYTGDEVIALNLQVYLPVVTGDLKWVALLVRGNASAQFATSDNAASTTSGRASTTW